jgi:peptide/nickel transport system permease protein
MSQHVDTEDAVDAPIADPGRPTARAADDARKERPLWRRLGLQFWICVGWIALIVLSALLAPWLPLDDPNVSDFRAVAAGPSSEHWLGTNDIGLDILSRIVWGSRVSLSVGVFSVLIGLVIGGAFGLVAGYFRGKPETTIMTVADGMLAFPALVLMLSLTVFLGQSLRNIVIAIGVVTIPVFIRLARANTLAYGQREFVLAARATGARDVRIILREVLPNVAMPLMAFSLVVVAVAIVAEGSLSFLGLSVPPTQPTWGNLIAGGRQDLAESPHIVFFPSLVLFITVMAFNLAGDRLRVVLEIKESAL